MDELPRVRGHGGGELARRREQQRLDGDVILLDADQVGRPDARLGEPGQGGVLDRQPDDRAPRRRQVHLRTGGERQQRFEQGDRVLAQVEIAAPSRARLGQGGDLGDVGRAGVALEHERHVEDRVPVRRREVLHLGRTGVRDAEQLGDRVQVRRLVRAQQGHPIRRRPLRRGRHLPPVHRPRHRRPLEQVEDQVLDAALFAGAAEARDVAGQPLPQRAQRSPDPIDRLLGAIPWCGAIAAGDDRQHSIGLRSDTDRRQRARGSEVLGGMDPQGFGEEVWRQRIEQLAQVVTTRRLPQGIDQRRLRAVVPAAGTGRSRQGVGPDAQGSGKPPGGDVRRTRPGRCRSSAAPTRRPARRAPW